MVVQKLCSYLSDTGTDTGQDSETLLVDIGTKNAPEEDGVLFVGSKLGGTLGSFNHDRRDDSTVKCTESISPLTYERGVHVNSRNRTSRNNERSGMVIGHWSLVMDSRTCPPCGMDLCCRGSASVQ